MILRTMNIFIGLYQVDIIDAVCLEHAIKDTLLRMGVSLSKCRGRCYDGVCGSRNGVATKLQKEEKRAVYTHCYGHAAVGQTMKQSKVCCEALEVGFEICKMFSQKKRCF